MQIEGLYRVDRGITSVNEGLFSISQNSQRLAKSFLDTFDLLEIFTSRKKVHASQLSFVP